MYHSIVYSYSKSLVWSKSWMCKRHFDPSWYKVLGTANQEYADAVTRLGFHPYSGTRATENMNALLLNTIKRKELRLVNGRRKRWSLRRKCHERMQLCWSIYWQLFVNLVNVYGKRRAADVNEHATSMQYIPEVWVYYSVVSQENLPCLWYS